MKMDNNSTPRRMLILGVFLVLLLTFFSGCIQTSESKGWFKETMYSEYPTNENTVLVVENINGDININGWSGDKITLDVEKKVEEKYKDQVDDVEVNVTTKSDKVVIKAIYNTAKRDVSVTMTIKVPHVVTLESVKDTNGDIKISDVKGDCEVTNTNGLINVNDLDGYIKATMTNGDIKIKDTTGINKVENINGNIDIDLYNLRADVDVSNTNGDIAVHILHSLDANITLETKNGLVKVHDITLEYSVNDGKNIVGTIGLGTHKVNLLTTNGNVDLYKLS